MSVRSCVHAVGRTALCLVVLSGVLTLSAGGASADESCSDPIVFVHDMGRDGREWRAWENEIRAAGLCSVTPTYGATAVSGVLEGAAGLTRIEDSAAEFAVIVDSIRRQTGSRRLRVVAHGAGGLVVAYYLKHLDPDRASDDGPSVTSLLTLGPLWGGTDIAGFGTVAETNKQLGIYEPLLALEMPVVEPLCAGCRQLIEHSDFMNALAVGGVHTAGVEYTDIISTHDLLMSDPMSAALPGSTSVVLQNVDPSNTANHFQLADDPLARRLALAALSLR